jgi:sugar phosphate isomerase/epimerase
LKAYADELGLIISQTHGRCRSFIGNKEADEITVEKCRLDCLATAALGAPACVIHSVATSSVGADAQPQYIRDLNHSMFMQILPFGKQYGVKIAAETFGDSPKYGCCDFFGDLEEFIRACERIEATEYKDYFTVCIDTGHSNKAMRFDNPAPNEVIRRIGRDRITLLHLNDNDGMTDQHKIPMTGNIDWEKVFAALDEVGYSGVYNMELNLRHFGKEFMSEHAAFAVKVLRNLLKKREKTV